MLSSSEKEEKTCFFHCQCDRSKLDEQLEAKKSRIIESVEQNDISTLRTLLDSKELYTIRNEFGNTLLHMAMYRSACLEENIFDHLLSLEDYPFDAVNDRGETALMLSLCGPVLSFHSTNDYFALNLIEKGADIHKICFGGNTLLHSAFKKNYVYIATLLVEKGVDINRQNDDGDTPLHMCCMYCSDEELVEGVTMLLTHGADPTIRNEKGHTALDYVIIKSGCEDVAGAAEILFYYLFDDYTEYDIDVEILLEAAAVQSPFFEQMLKIIGKVFVNDNDVEYRCRDLFIMKPKYLHVFIDKFDYLIREILDKTETLTLFDNSRSISAENFYILAESKLQSEFVEWLRKVELIGLVRNCIEKYRESEVSLRELVCFLLSYGMTIEKADLHLVFREFGFCELFKLLLHMDLTVSFHGDTDVMPRLLYDFKADTQKLIEEPLTLTVKDLGQMLPYFAFPRLKRLYMLEELTDVIEKIRNQPEIPLLVEMARNVFRRYFVQKLNIANARQFYTQLNLLPISSYHKKIISLEVTLY